MSLSGHNHMIGMFAEDGGGGDIQLPLDKVLKSVDSMSVGAVKKVVDSTATSSITQTNAMDHMTLTKNKAFSFLEVLHTGVQRLCDIPSCGDKCDRLTYATSGVLAYYGLQDSPIKVTICRKCKEKAEEFEKKFVQAIRNGESIGPFEHDPQNKCQGTVVDLEDDVVGGGGANLFNVPLRSDSEEIEMDFESWELDGILKDVLKKYNIPHQLAKYKQELEDHVNKLETEIEELNDMTMLQDKIYDIYKRYNDHFDKIPKPIIAEEIEINPDGSLQQKILVNDEQLVNSESIKVLASRPTKISLKASWETDGKTPVRKPGPASKTGYNTALNAQRSKPSKRKIQKTLRPRAKVNRELLKTPKLVPMMEPEVGDTIYVMYGNLLNIWVKADILEVIPNEMTENPDFVVHCEPMKNGHPTGGKVGKGIERPTKRLCLKQMAMNGPCPFALPVGSRIIAKFKAEHTTSSSPPEGQYYAGIVAEPPKESFGYLIFFDNGNAQYVHPDNVLLVCESEMPNDVYPDSYDFIKEYITKYPDWPLVKLHVGSIVATEFYGFWLPARILKVNKSLALVKFEYSGREEWIYRGSTRFRPIYRVTPEQEEMIRGEQQEQNATNQIQPQDPDHFSKGTQPAVENNGKEQETSKALSPITTKSTGCREFHKELERFTGTNGFPSNQVNILDPDLCIEYQGFLTEIKIPKSAPKPKVLEYHECGPSCVVTNLAPIIELKSKSPLAIPLLFGWSRQVYSEARHSIFYITPCGRKLLNYKELAIYLDETNANLSIDHFCFNYDVQCLNKFVPSRSVVSIDDISNGKESTPVQCINSINSESLPILDYTTENVMAPDVTVPTDEHFLVCCECTDNCEDKDNCACCQLTYQEIASTQPNSSKNKKNQMKGYVRRRLQNDVVSGIYECNSRCKCRQTCSNRVVQAGVQWPLQVFKTSKKGWGVRTLYDMPKGTFVCTYSGLLMTDGMANKQGKENGDEYFANLDFIEANENLKEGYESDVSDIEAENENQTTDKSEVVMDNLLEINNKVKTMANLFSIVHDAEDRVDLGFILNNDGDMTKTTECSPKISQSRKRKRIKHRNLYGTKEGCYVIDAKHVGNVGGYLNHSCRPNLSTQNVFVKTHDIRFPLVAFFTKSVVKAGSELTWNYNYEVESVEGKEIYCACMSPGCIGKLL